MSLTGTMAANESGFAEELGVSWAEGAAQLEQQGHHVDVRDVDVRRG